MKKNLNSHKFNAFWYSSIEKISSEEWEQIFGKNKVKSYLFFKATELSNLQDTAYHYLRITSNDKIVGITPCFSYKMSLDILAPPFIKKISKIIQFVFPHFLHLSIFGVGSLTSTCSQHIGIRKDISEEELVSIKDIIVEQINLKAQSMRHKIVFLKEVPQNELNYVKDIFKDYCFYYSLPNCYVPLLKNGESYPSTLKGKERHRIRSLKNKFDKHYKWELTNNSIEIVEAFEKLYLETFEKSQNKFEILNKKYFTTLNKLFDDSSFFLIARNNLGQIESVGIILEDENSLTPLYLGINHNNNVNLVKLLHANSIIRVIEEAELRKKSCVILGQTSYYSKVLSGAIVEKLYLGFHSHSRFMKFLIKHFFSKLFTDTEVLNNVYMQNYQEILKKWTQEQGIDICNI